MIVKGFTRRLFRIAANKAAVLNIYELKKLIQICSRLQRITRSNIVILQLYKFGDEICLIETSNPTSKRKLFKCLLECKKKNSNLQ